MFKRMHDHKGFTLIELMIVVAIIGILAAVAIPNFLKYQAKSKQSEARVLLSGLYTSQVAYFAEQNAYGAWDADFSAGALACTPISTCVTNNDIGFEPASVPKYYQVIATAVVAAPAGFTSTTSTDLDGDATTDDWQVTEGNREPQNTCNDVTNLDQLGAAC
jgi:type IV pilus assembly protein PilA